MRSRKNSVDPLVSETGERDMIKRYDILFNCEYAVEREEINLTHLWRDSKIENVAPAILYMAESRNEVWIAVGGVWGE